MDTCMADLTELPDREHIRTGSEIVLFGRQTFNGREAILTVDEMAEWLDTINYEVTCLIGKRVPRVYFKDGMLEHVSNYLI